VRTSITPFGLSGPYRDWQATGSTLLALGGYTWLHGDIGRTPLTMPGNYPHYQAGSYAYTASLAAELQSRGEVGGRGETGGSGETGGRGEAGAAPARVEVSTMETLAGLHQFTFVMATHAGTVRSRHGNRWENLSPTGLLPCKDGWWGMNVLPNFWEPFALWLGIPELLSDPRFAENRERVEHSDELEEVLAGFFAEMPPKQVFKDGQEIWRVPVGYMMSLQDGLEDPHMNERGFWRPAGRSAGSPFQFVGSPPPEERPAVAPGADTDAVLAALPAGSTEPSRSSGSSESRSGGSAPGRGSRPLEGIRVVDMTRIWSGPLATVILGDLGADVVKIEAQFGRGPANVPAALGGLYPGGTPGDRPWNRQGLFNKLNRNKRSVALDLKSERGRELFLQLVAESDIVIENFSARAMPGLGLGYDRLREANERIIYLAMPAFGQTGPYRDYIGLGPSIEPLIGLTALMGYSDDEPRVTSVALTDAISGVVAASAMVTALDRRERTGEGGLIDLSQHEAGVTMIGEYFIDRQLTGAEPVRDGNGHPTAAPHGVYRCAGEDDWIALAATDDGQWQALAATAASDSPAATGWGSDPRFASVEGRREYRAALDEAIEAWTAGHDKHKLMRELQAAGVPAGVVYTPPEVLADPHLEERGYWVELDEPDGGLQRYDGSPLRFDGERGYEQWAAAPGLGADNAAVLEGLLGLSAEDVAALYEAQVIVDRPPG
jgi:crotonobetainyl-CoA:carnitine CoA-transferase CaiB-like acyl-CoA transferase